MDLGGSLGADGRYIKGWKLVEYIVCRAGEAGGRGRGPDLVGACVSLGLTGLVFCVGLGRCVELPRFCVGLPRLWVGRGDRVVVDRVVGWQVHQATGARNTPLL